MMMMVCIKCKQCCPADLCSLCSSSWQSLQVRVSQVSQKSLRASCLCTGQKTGLWPDVPTDSTTQNQSKARCFDYFSLLYFILTVYDSHMFSYAPCQTQSKWGKLSGLALMKTLQAEQATLSKTLPVAIATVPQFCLLNVKTRQSVHSCRKIQTSSIPLEQSRLLPLRKQLYGNCLANKGRLKRKLISLWHIPGDTSSFLRILWSLVNLTLWCASMQVLQSHSPHSTQNPIALALSSQLVHTCYRAKQLRHFLNQGFYRFHQGTFKTF